MSETVISIKDLSKSFGDHEVLRKIDIDVHSGEVICIVGSSGSGKSTLLRCINKLEKQTSGKILYHDKEVRNVQKDINDYRSKVGMVFQSFNLFSNMTVLENCMVGQIKVLKKDKETARKRAMEYLEKVGMAPYIQAKPRQISGGQKQRVAIARALANNPSVIIADEPTGNLDSATSLDVMGLLKVTAQKFSQTIVMITHDLGVVASMCEKIAVMYAGHIVEYGTTDEIFYQPGHEYTKGLINSIPKLNTAEHERLVPIEGTPVDLLNPPAGCPFAPRCKNCMKICLSKMPPRTELSDTHYTYCWLQQKAAFEKGEKAE